MFRVTVSLHTFINRETAFRRYNA